MPVSSIQRTQLLPMSTLTRRQQTPDPAMYTQVASQSNKPIYIPPPRQYLNRPADESTAETPLIGCDNKVIGFFSLSCPGKTEKKSLLSFRPQPFQSILFTFLFHQYLPGVLSSQFIQNYFPILVLKMIQCNWKRKFS